MLFWLAADRATALRANSSGVLREIKLACVATKSDADQAVLSSTRESRFVRDQSGGSNMITEWASASAARRGLSAILGLPLNSILLILARCRRSLQTRPNAVNYKNVDLCRYHKDANKLQSSGCNAWFGAVHSLLFFVCAIFCYLQKFSVEVLFRASAISRKTFKRDRTDVGSVRSNS
jgi:hypothetical protein